jgi:hypothetical protein
MLGAAGIGYLLLRVTKLAPEEQTLRVLDADALYRGPAAGAGRWVGVVLLRLFGATQSLLDRIGQQLGRRAALWARDCDRPYRAGLASAAPIGALAVVLMIALWWRQF